MPECTVNRHEEPLSLHATLPIDDTDAYEQMAGEDVAGRPQPAAITIPDEPGEDP